MMSFRPRGRDHTREDSVPCARRLRAARQVRNVNTKLGAQQAQAAAELDSASGAKIASKNARISKHSSSSASLVRI